MGKSARLFMPLIIFVAFLLVPLLAPSAAWAAEFGDDWQPVKRQIDDGKYYLQNDVTYTRPMQVFGTATIDLNGHTITFAPTGGNDGYLYIGPKAHVTLQDSAGGGRIVGGTGRTEGTGGSIGYGGGIFIDSSKNGTATLVMTGGTIANCTAALGGGVAVERGATFTMTGGSIESCSARNGGGVWVSECVSEDGTTTPGGTFVMSGGTISGCSASNVGGGVLVAGDTATLTMSGTATIAGNTVDTGDGSAIALLGTAGTMYADGGRVVGDLYLNTGRVTRSTTASDYTSLEGGVKIQAGSVDDAAKVPVSFDGNGGSPQTSVLRAFKGQTLDSRPATPAKAGSAFMGWYLGDVPFDFDAPLTGPVNVGARWTSTISDATVSLDQDSFAYDGQPHAPAVSVSLPSGPLVEGRDYQLSGEVSATDAGIHSIVVRGMGVMKGSVDASWTITQADQTVTAEDVSTAYGAADAAVSGTGIGALSYGVVEGADVVSVDETTGKLAIHELGNATVRVTAAGDVNHRPASTEVMVSVGKGTPRVVAWPAITDLYVNEALEDGHLEGGNADVDGAFSLGTPGESWGRVGEQQAEVVFVPADDAHYLPLEQQVPVNVVRRTVEGVVSEAPAVDGMKTGTPIEELGLPATVTIVTSGGREYEVPVTWSGYDAEVPGRQMLTGALDLSEVADEVEQGVPEVAATATVELQAPVAPQEKPQAKGKTAAAKEPAPQASSGSTATPATGDDTPAVPASVALLAGAACLALCLRNGRRARG